jgi:hypothetical protein
MTTPIENGGPLQISVSLEVGGSAYGLDPLSRRLVQKRFPDARGLPGVFFGYHKKEEFEELHKPLWPLAATLLTGLTLEQIGELGGIQLSNPRTGKVYWDWRPELATAK